MHQDSSAYLLMWGPLGLHFPFFLATNPGCLWGNDRTLTVNILDEAITYNRCPAFSKSWALVPLQGNQTLRPAGH